MIDEEDGKKDCVKALFAKIEGDPPEWHDFMDVGINTSHVLTGGKGSLNRGIHADYIVVF